MENWNHPNGFFLSIVSKWKNVIPSLAQKLDVFRQLAITIWNKQNSTDTNNEGKEGIVLTSPCGMPNSSTPSILIVAFTVNKRRHRAIREVLSLYLSPCTCQQLSVYQEKGFIYTFINVRCGVYTISSFQTWCFALLRHFACFCRWGWVIPFILPAKDYPAIDNTVARVLKNKFEYDGDDDNLIQVNKLPMNGTDAMEKVIELMMKDWVKVLVRKVCFTKTKNTEKRQTTMYRYGTVPYRMKIQGYPAKIWFLQILSYRTGRDVHAPRTNAHGRQLCVFVRAFVRARRFPS